ncbi:MAG: BMP family ABC transporter substrate-binding protein [Caldiserica bacterium CG23_combo_of_CG06-09_8_20_14_all_35_60]|nr:MAG: BMP family ABC transporter substrate-binding protein [Caldiserica bacterium CG23_combo_of_CG06-09_8_20_14_all_35_60]
MKKLLVLLLVVGLAVTVFAGCKTAPPVVTKIKVGLVTDVGGRGDRSFNDSALRGLETWAVKVEYVQGGGYSAITDAQYTASIPDDLKNMNITALNVEPIVLEAKAKEDYIPNIQNLVEQQNCQLVIGVGFMLAGAIGESALKYPDTKFMLIDATPVDADGNTIDPANVVSYLFKENECGYLVGAIAGYVTNTNKVGYVGGMAIPPVLRYEAGYRAGVKTTNPTATIYGQYTNSFTDPSLGKTATDAQIGLGADVIFHAAGATGNGMFQAICEKGAPYWGIGVDVDMGLDPNLCPDRTLTSSIKHVDLATYDAIKSVVNNAFQSGAITLSLKDGGVGYAPDHVADVLTQDQITKIENLRTMIINGTITVPEDPKNVDSWTPPASF